LSRLVVLDALGLAYRAYYAFIGRPLRNSRGENTSAIVGFSNSALKLRRELAPDYWALAWDGPGPTFRHQLYPGYKATRPPMPGDLAAQLDPIEELAQDLGLPVIEKSGMEADDVMATLATRAAEAGHEVVLVTGDKDMLQVVSERVTVLNPQGKGEDYQRIDATAVREKWGVGPEHIRDVLALMGDTSDDIPGVPGVGEKTAVELMSRFGSLESLYERLDEVTKPALKNRLVTHRDLAFLSRDLATVRRDLDLGLDLDELRIAPIRRDDLRAFAQRWEVRRLERVADEQGVTAAGDKVASRPAERRGSAAEQPGTGVTLGAPRPSRVEAAAAVSSRGPVAAPAGDLFAALAVTSPAPRPADVAPVTATQGELDLWSAAATATLAGPGLDETIERLNAVRARSPHGLGLVAVWDGPDPRHARLVGLTVSARDGTACYLPIAHEGGPVFPIERVREWLAPALGDPATLKVAHDLKRLRHVLAAAGLPLEGGAFDLHLGSFLCDPSRDHSLAGLARDFLAIELEPIEAPAVRGRPRPGPAALPVSLVAPAAERRAAALFPVADQLFAQLERAEQWPLYRDLEHPLIGVLWAMERAGVALDPAVLTTMSQEATRELARLESELYALAGEPVNLNSGPQLGRILFEKLGLKTGKRTKTGYSTDSEVLESLASTHAFPRLLLEWRALSKLQSTYLDALPASVDPGDARVHTTYEQTGAATGRLSSSDPNLQNIPMRTEQGRAIRRAFVAAPGMTMIGADYSQIELRVMAHLSRDPGLIEAFATGEDVHASTARRIFKVSGALDPALRARAKIVNFGIMYGMGSRSLAQQMGITLEEARAFIDDYFGAFAGVRRFLDRTVAEARERGWVETILKRRRYLPALRSDNGLERSNAERAAINTPIQGSAADLVKLAMIKVHQSLERGRSPARLLLQVHDELLLECPVGDADEVAAIVQREMESCYELKVPLTVSLGRGRSWFDVH
jgi:DNA polymerase-1